MYHLLHYILMAYAFQLEIVPEVTKGQQPTTRLLTGDTF